MLSMQRKSTPPHEPLGEVQASGGVSFAAAIVLFWVTAHWLEVSVYLAMGGRGRLEGSAVFSVVTLPAAALFAIVLILDGSHFRPHRGEAISMRYLVTWCVWACTIIASWSLLFGMGLPISTRAALPLVFQMWSISSFVACITLVTVRFAILPWFSSPRNLFGMMSVWIGLSTALGCFHFWLESLAT